VRTRTHGVKSTKPARTLLAAAILLLALVAGLPAQQRSDWVSPETIASVVRLGKTFDLYIVSGIPAGHQVTVQYGTPDFGGGRIVHQERVYGDLGSGVIVSENGWMVSNAHVADDWTPQAIQVAPVQDNQGNPLTQVVIPANPGYMWVKMASVEDIENNVRKLEVRYLATTWYSDMDYYSYDRDRAICKITATARMNETTGLPEMVEELAGDETFPHTALRNPFDIPFQESGIASMGYPGIGPASNVTISRGDFIGYASEDRAQMMHTAFISGGNSGGGLFYKDRLIGINTWDRADARGRNVSIAQPITFFGEAFAAVRLWYDVNDLPEIPANWVTSDPTNDPYKNQVFVGFNLRSRVNENVALKNGVLLAHEKGVDIQEAMAYIDFKQYMNNYLAVKKLLRVGYDVQSIASRLGLGLMEVQTLAQMSEEELTGTLSGDGKKYYELWKKGAFHAGFWRVDQNGQVLTALPPSSSVNLTVMASGYDQKTISFSTKRDVVQGPWTIKVPPKGK